MTCILGVKKGKNLFIASDSMTNEAGKKVTNMSCQKIHNCGTYLIGFAGLTRMQTKLMGRMKEESSNFPFPNPTRNIYEFAHECARAMNPTAANQVCIIVVCDSGVYTLTYDSVEDYIVQKSIDEVCSDVSFAFAGSGGALAASHLDIESAMFPSSIEDEMNNAVRMACKWDLFCGGVVQFGSLESVTMPGVPSEIEEFFGDLDDKE